MRHLLIVTLLSAATLLSACDSCGCQATAPAPHSHAKAEAKPAAKACPAITLSELEAAISAKTVTVIDCNGSESFAKGRIPGAKDFAVIQTKLAEHLPADKGALIVAYCGGPKCGAYKKACEAVAQLGYTNCKHLGEGISGWKAAQKPVEATAAK